MAAPSLQFNSISGNQTLDAQLESLPRSKFNFPIPVLCGINVQEQRVVQIRLATVDCDCMAPPFLCVEDDDDDDLRHKPGKNVPSLRREMRNTCQ